MKIENQYIIHFKGLKEGVHHFTFAVEKAFFDSFEQLEIPDGNISVNVDLDKRQNFLELLITLSGKAQVHCDRCLGVFGLPVSFQGRLIVRFSETEKEPDDEIIFLHPDEQQVDLRHYLYECISLSMPLRKIHPDLPGGVPGCDLEMMSRLNEHLIQE